MKTLYVLMIIFSVKIIPSSAHQSNLKQEAGIRNRRNATEEQLFATVTVAVGQTATLRCFAEELHGQTVTWIRTRDLHLLTVGKFTYTASPRIQSLKDEEFRNQKLLIKNVQENDGGGYECTDSTVLKKTLVTLHVGRHGHQPRIWPEGDHFLAAGEPLKITCRVGPIPISNDYVFWYREDLLLRQNERQKIVNHFTHDNFSTSELLISNVKADESGNYTCRFSNNDQGATTNVHVLNITTPSSKAHIHGIEESTPDTQSSCQDSNQDLSEVYHKMMSALNTLTQLREILERKLSPNQMNASGKQTDHGHNPVHGHGHHHHHQHQQDQNPSHRMHGHRHRHEHPPILKPPPVRNPEDFDFAVCHLKPNPTVPDSTVHGIIYLSQKKNSDTLYMRLSVAGFKSVNIGDHPIPAEHVHGLRVHENPDFANGCQSAGAYFNPSNTSHREPNSPIRHFGDFGNVTSNEEGVIDQMIWDEVASLRGTNAILGRPLVIHARGSDVSDPRFKSSPFSGVYLACCVIERRLDAKAGH